jgi:hypothetical protein
MPIAVAADYMDTEYAHVIPVCSIMPYYKAKNDALLQAAVRNAPERSWLQHV